MSIIRNAARCSSNTVALMFETRGSGTAPGAIAEAIRRGTAPAAIIMVRPDINLAVGAAVAEALYGRGCPSSPLMVLSSVKRENIRRLSKHRALADRRPRTEAHSAASRRSLGLASDRRRPEPLLPQMRNTFQRRASYPTETRPVPQETMAERARPSTIGDSHRKVCVVIRKATRRSGGRSPYARHACAGVR